MATGYTHPVCDGDVTDFAQFALQCARAFGATVEQRDEGMDALPRLPEPDDYHLEQLHEARAKVAEIEGWSDSEAGLAALAHFERQVAERRESAARTTERIARCEAILAQVQSWRPPTPDHEGLRDFMITQLAETIEWERPLDRPVPVRMSGAEFKAEALRRARDDVEYHQRQYDEEVARCAERREWITALYASVGRELAQT